MNWHQKQMNDIVHMQSKLYGCKSSNQVKFRLNESVRTNRSFGLSDSVIPMYVNGTIKQINENSLSVEFTGFGIKEVPIPTANSCFDKVERRSTDIIRKSLSSKVDESFPVGSRVSKDNKQYLVEQVDTFSRNAILLDESGKKSYCSLSGFIRLDENEDLAAKGNIPSCMFNANDNVKVVAINPNFNQWRQHGIPEQEAPGYKDKICKIVFAYYPVSNVCMFRTLVDNAGYRDFSSDELALA